MARPRKLHEQRDTLEINDYLIPVRIITESGRYSARASVTSQSLIVRLPYGLNSGDRDEQLTNMLRWARETLANKPAAFAQFKRVKTSGAYIFTIRGEAYELNVVTHELKHHKILEVAPNRLEIRVNPTDSRLGNGKLLPKLLAKHFGGVHLPRVTARVHELNEQHFGQSINAVRLSDTYSRWGSCSSKGNINLATRLVLAPDEVLDAVIIHELAHLLEANHSSRFWAHVARALPDYQTYDVWLKDHGKELLFKPIPI